MRKLVRHTSVIRFFGAEQENRIDFTDCHCGSAHSGGHHSVVADSGDAKYRRSTARVAVRPRLSRRFVDTPLAFGALCAKTRPYEQSSASRPQEPRCYSVLPIRRGRTPHTSLHGAWPTRRRRGDEAAVRRPICEAEDVSERDDVSTSQPGVARRVRDKLVRGSADGRRGDVAVDQLAGGRVRGR
jgi:hypothetical protein